MAQQDCTSTATQLASITADTIYYLQNRSQEALFLQVAAAAPTGNEGAFIVNPFDDRLVQTIGSDNVYIWNSRGTGHIVYDLAPA